METTQLLVQYDCDHCGQLLQPGYDVVQDYRGGLFCDRRCATLGKPQADLPVWLRTRRGW